MKLQKKVKSRFLIHSDKKLKGVLWSNTCIHPKTFHLGMFRCYLEVQIDKTLKEILFSHKIAECH